MSDESTIEIVICGSPNTNISSAWGSFRDYFLIQCLKKVTVLWGWKGLIEMKLYNETDSSSGDCLDRHLKTWSDVCMLPHTKVI